MFNKIKNWIIAILSILVGIFGVYLVTDNDKKELEEAKKEIKKAGEKVDEAETFDNADNAAHYIDNVLSNIDGKGNKKSDK